MSGRKPRTDELELWNKVATNVTPMKHPAPKLPEEMTRKPEPMPPKAVAPITPPRISGGKSPLRDDLAPALGHALKTQPVHMDRKAFRKMQRGKLKPDARIDLHGMTLERAHNVLNRFVLSSQASGCRLLLVITGKGKNRDDGGPIPVRYGVLRHQVPQWLRLPPLSSAVLQVTEAHVSHGGGGAYYVYLRKRR